LFEVTNKYNGELPARVPACDKEIFEMAVRTNHMPYGRVKESGLGRERVKYAVEEMTDI